MRSTSTFTAILLSLGLTAFASANMIINPGFESGVGTDADNWTQIAAPPHVFPLCDRVAIQPHSGDYHMQLTVTGSALGGPIAEIQQQTPLFSVTPGQSYDYSIWGKRVGDFGPGALAALEIQWLDSDGSHGGGVKGSTGWVVINLTPDYQPYNIFAAVAAADSDAALVMARVVGGAFQGSDGTAYFDDVNFTPEPTSLALLGIATLLGGLRRR